MKIETVRKMLCLVLIVFVLLGMSTIVKATDPSYSANIELLSNSELVEGQEVEITVKLTSVNAGAGISVLQGYLTYDPNVFEAVTADDMEGLNRWGYPTYNASNGCIIVNKTSSKVNTPSDIFKITLKVKSTVDSDSTVITLGDNANPPYEKFTVSGGTLASGGTGDIEVPAASITISKPGTTTGGGDSTDTPGDEDTGSGSQGDDSQGDENQNGGSQGDESQNGGSQGSGSQGDESQNGGSQGSGSQNGGSQDDKNQGGASSGTGSQSSDKSSETKDNNGAKKSSLPKTGAAAYIITSMVVVSGIGVIGYKLYKKYEEI